LFFVRLLREPLCATHGEADVEAQERLAFYLHTLGIALNYRDDRRLQDTHVLNPRWVTNGIYKMGLFAQSPKKVYFTGYISFNPLIHMLL